MPNSPGDGCKRSFLVKCYRISLPGRRVLDSPVETKQYLSILGGSPGRSPSQIFGRSKGLSIWREGRGFGKEWKGQDLVVVQKQDAVPAQKLDIVLAQSCFKAWHCSCSTSKTLMLFKHKPLFLLKTKMLVLLEKHALVLLRNQRL